LRAQPPLSFVRVNPSGLANGSQSSHQKSEFLLPSLVAYPQSLLPTGYDWGAIHESFNVLVRRCGLKSEPPFNITLHTLRHTFGSWLAVEGVPLRAIQKLMGHKSITTTERYADLSGENLGTAVERIERRSPKSLPSGAEEPGNGSGQAVITLRKEWCGGRESNPHSPCGPRDFKSLASTSSATPARWVRCLCYHEFGPLVEPLFPTGAALGPIELAADPVSWIPPAAKPVSRRGRDAI